MHKLEIPLRTQLLKGTVLRIWANGRHLTDLELQPDGTFRATKPEDLFVSDYEHHIPVPWEEKDHV